MAKTKFHFIDDYRNLVNDLIQAHPLHQAMSMAVGGNFEAFGEIEKQLLIGYGLQPEHTIIDIGCGSGRLAKSLMSHLTTGCFLGTDVVQALLDYAKQDCPSSWQFQLVEEIRIPYATNCADYCTFFSVFTHLLHEESYCYLLEARRTVKKGGLIIFSFLEYPYNWEIFEATVNNILMGKPNVHLNTFISRAAIECWVQHLGLSIVAIHAATAPFINLPQPVLLDGGQKIEGMVALGQSVAVLKVN
ncbi:MAG: class I SAM-dependent methyltransferase [Nitrosomonas sp.]|nr:MAG: class I SAM-dependent methyltransferase [Nitrosomonas sp.]